MSWLVIAILVAGSYGFKAFGVFGLARQGSGQATVRLARVTAFIPAALFAALIIVQTVGTDQSLSIDARLVGLAASVVAVSRKAPLVVVVLVAMAATAAVRAVAG